MLTALFIGLGSIGTRHLKNLTAICAQRGLALRADALRSDLARPLRPGAAELLHEDGIEARVVKLNRISPFRGGELSRIMLALKTITAKQEKIGTFIFDEIDAGISGRTAQMVAEKIKLTGKNHQIICITHLPQIAAMADVHFVIEKSSTDDMTITDIHKVSAEESLAELARLLGSDALTEAALSNAKEMKEQAGMFKETR